MPPDGNGYRHPCQGLPLRRMPLDRGAVRHFLKGNKKNKKMDAWKGVTTMISFMLGFFFGRWFVSHLPLFLFLAFLYWLGGQIFGW